MTSKQTTYIPVYEGNSDFTLNYEHINAHIVLPFEKRHKKFLRNYNATLSHLYPFVSHIKFLANNDKLPPSIKDENGKRKPRSYINLSTGQIISEDAKKNGIFNQGNDER